MELVFETMAGLESVAAAELRSHGLTSRVLAPGRLASRPETGPGSEWVVRLNADLRCCDRLGLLLHDSAAPSLHGIESAAASVPWQEFLDPGATFAVRGTRRGSHSFRSVEIAGWVGEVVIDGIRARCGARIPVNLSDPDQIVRAELFDDQFLLWLDSTGDAGLWVRGYRRYLHMASMRPTVANLLLRLSGWEGAPLLDPFCGGATLLIEAAHGARATSPAALRGQGWAWQRTPLLAGGRSSAQSRAAAGAGPARGTEVPASGTGGPACGSGGPACGSGAPAGFATLRGVERFRRHVEGAIENIAAAGLTGAVRIHSGLAERCDQLVGPGAWTVVTNPPFGRRVGDTRQIWRMYARAAKAWARAGVEKVTTLADNQVAMEDALEGAGYRCETTPATYGRIPVTVFQATARESSVD